MGGGGVGWGTCLARLDLAKICKNFAKTFHFDFFASPPPPELGVTVL